MLVVALHAHAQNAWIRVHGGSWEPDSKVVTELKAGLERYVKAAARGQRRELRNWAEYIFQYQGREEKGQKYILVNAICRRDPKWNLERQVIPVFDAGLASSICASTQNAGATTTSRSTVTPETA